MGYTLAIGDRSHSSWSLRAWLLFAKAGIPVKLLTGRLYSDDFARLLAEFQPAHLVPALRLPSGLVIGETLAIAETLAERHPAAGLWPDDPDARAMARWLAAEMHAGFVALRNHCPMNLRVSYEDCAPPDEVLIDLARIETLWAQARARFANAAESSAKTSAAGPWLFGRWSVADAFFAPVATRIATYNLPVGPATQDYTALWLADADFRRWRAMGFAEGSEQPYYRREWARRPWPGPEPLPARLAEGPSVNATCPYSGQPVTHMLEFEGRIWGFCNAFCRDKTLFDPEAWPEFIAMVRRH